MATALIDVIVEAGGSHQFDLGHLRREGAVPLVRLLLQTAGYDQPRCWHIRVEKKVACTAMTRAVAVVGAKPWCCYLKIKPGDNNTGHFCSLLMPDGQHGDAAFRALKSAEDRVNYAWRHGPQEKNMTAGEMQFEPAPPAGPDAPPAVDAEEWTVPAVPAVPAADEAAVVNGTSAILGWSHDPDRVRLTLLAIHELAHQDTVQSYEQFIAALIDKLGWNGLRRKQIGGVFTALVRRGHIRKQRGGPSANSLPIGYVLTPQGEQLIRDLLPVGEIAARSPDPTPPAEMLPADSESMIAALTQIAQEYGAAHRKLQEFRVRRAQLVEELARLDTEAAELRRVALRPEVQALLEQLVQLTGSGGQQS